MTMTRTTTTDPVAKTPTTTTSGIPYRRTIVAVAVAAFVLLVGLMFLASEYHKLPDANLRFRQTLASSTASSSSSAAAATFKILQVADLHLGEAENTDWGPLQDVHSFMVLDAVIGKENPDLIVLSGDQITANDIDKNATAYYQILGKKLGQYGIPWALIFGNHDDQPFETVLRNGTIVKHPAKTSRRQLLRSLQQFKLSRTQGGPTNVFGASNYAFYIKDARGANAAQIVFLDTGGGSLPQQLQSNQLTWLKQHMSKTLPVIVFQHIPSSTQAFGFVQSRCKGFQGEGVAPLAKQPGIIQALLNAGNVRFLAVGHNHGNDYCCRITGTVNQQQRALHVCFGRHTGYGGYGAWDRGARVYELQLGQGSTFSWKSWVRLAFGQVIDGYTPA